MQADVVNMNLERLEKALGPMKNSSGSQGHEDASEFTVLVEWGMNFCKGAQIDVKIKQQEDLIKKAKADVGVKTTELRRCDRIMNEIRVNNFHTFHSDAIKNNSEKLELIAPVHKKDYDQAEKFQRDFNTFESIFYVEFNQIYKQRAGNRTGNASMSHMGLMKQARK